MKPRPPRSRTVNDAQIVVVFRRLGTAEGRMTLPAYLINERRVEAADRAVSGHREGDLVISLQRSTIDTLVERATGFTMLVRLPWEEGYGVALRRKNGQALAAGAAATWDRSKVSDHAPFTVATGVKVYFAKAHRGSIIT